MGEAIPKKCKTRKWQRWRGLNTSLSWFYGIFILNFCSKIYRTHHEQTRGQGGNSRLEVTEASPTLLLFKFKTHIATFEPGIFTNSASWQPKDGAVQRRCCPCLTMKTLAVQVTVEGQRRGCLETLMQTTSLIGHANVMWLLSWRKQACIYHARMYLWALTTQRYFHMDNKLQALLLTSLPLLAALILSCYCCLHVQKARYYLSEFWQFPCSAVPSALHWLEQLHQWSCGSRRMVRKLLHVGPDQPDRPQWKSASACRGTDVFSQRQPACCINVTLVTRADSRKPPVPLDFSRQVFCHHPTRLQSNHNLPEARLHENPAQTPKWTSLSSTSTKHTICHSAWEPLTAHTHWSKTTPC